MGRTIDQRSDCTGQSTPMAIDSIFLPATWGEPRDPLGFCRKRYASCREIPSVRANSSAVVPCLRAIANNETRILTSSVEIHKGVKHRRNSQGASSDPRVRPRPRSALPSVDEGVRSGGVLAFVP
jgi:hypothetical protein